MKIPRNDCPEDNLEHDIAGDAKNDAGLDEKGGHDDDEIDQEDDDDDGFREN